MEHLTEQTSKYTELLSKLLDGEIQYDRAGFEQRVVDRYNASEGDLEYYNCPKCLNRGNFMRLENGYQTLYLCDCMKVRHSNRLLLESGMAKLIEEKTFENYICNEPWQDYLMSKCRAFVDCPTKCLFIGGQSGSGKTHLCTAVCGKLVQQGKSLRYVLWRDIVTKLQANVFNDENYTNITDDLKNVDVLYLDDMFKLISTKSDNRLKELEVAFKIINDRELSQKTTIISTECTFKDLVNLDEAIAGRIIKMATSDYILQIDKNVSRNYRLKNLAII